MDLRTSAAATVMALVALSGCSDDGDGAPAITDEYCAGLGLVVGTIEHMDGMRTGDEAMAGNGSMDGNGSMEGSDAMAGEAMGHTSEPACVDPGPPATVALEGVPESTPQYKPISFQWVLDTDLAEAHTMRTEVRVSTTSVSDDALAGPDSYGELVEQKEHQNFVAGTAYPADFTPEDAAMLYFRAYALVNGEDLWSPEYEVEVTPPVPTGIVHTLSASLLAQVFDATGLGDGVSPPEITITVGDAIEFSNDDVLPHGFTSTSVPPGADGFATGQLGNGATSDPILLLVPGLYDFTSDDALLAFGGRIVAAVPA